MGSHIRASPFTWQVHFYGQGLYLQPLPKLCHRYACAQPSAWLMLTFTCWIDFPAWSWTCPITTGLPGNHWTVADPDGCNQTCPALLEFWETAPKSVRPPSLLGLSSPCSFWLTVPSCCSISPLNIHQRQVGRIGLELWQWNKLQSSHFLFIQRTIGGLNQPVWTSAIQVKSGSSILQMEYVA